MLNPRDVFMYGLCTLFYQSSISQISVLASTRENGIPHFLHTRGTVYCWETGVETRSFYGMAHFKKNPYQAPPWYVSTQDILQEFNRRFHVVLSVVHGSVILANYFFHKKIHIKNKSVIRRWKGEIKGSNMFLQLAQESRVKSDYQALTCIFCQAKLAFP